MARGRPFEKGNKAAANRGSNKITRTVKETVLEVFERLQLHETANLESWGESNPTEFYKIAAKLIPAEVNANVEATIKGKPYWLEDTETPKDEGES